MAQTTSTSECGLNISGHFFVDEVLDPPRSNTACSRQRHHLISAHLNRCCSSARGQSVTASESGRFSAHTGRPTKHLIDDWT
jgi:hypothetical protein